MEKRTAAAENNIHCGSHFILAFCIEVVEASSAPVRGCVRVCEVANVAQTEERRGCECDRSRHEWYMKMTLPFFSHCSHAFCPISISIKRDNSFFQPLFCRLHSLQSNLFVYSGNHQPFTVMQWSKPQEYD